ncbi:DeoR family transcriptional regulator [Anaerococcus sp. ENR0831]|uniref:DeoR family transcriptional regulator n=1 Tax=Anaerococcus martiniensis TaxID=3115615 RepID=A0ABW9M8L6_9FIRM
MKCISIMILEERLNFIRSVLNKQGTISNAFLLQQLNISESTLRRDLDYLQEKGEIIRAHG